MRKVKMGMRKIGARFLEEWKLFGMLYANDIIFCGESEGDL